MTETKPKRTWKVTKRSLLDRIEALTEEAENLRYVSEAWEREAKMTTWQRVVRWVRG